MLLVLSAEWGQAWRELGMWLGAWARVERTHQGPASLPTFQSKHAGLGVLQVSACVPAAQGHLGGADGRAAGAELPRGAEVPEPVGPPCTCFHQHWSRIWLLIIVQGPWAQAPAPGTRLVEACAYF